MQLYRMALANDGSKGKETSSRPRSVSWPVEVRASIRNKFLRLLSSWSYDGLSKKSKVVMLFMPRDLRVRIVEVKLTLRISGTVCKGMVSS